MSWVVEKQSDHHGRCFVATSRIRPGQTIVQEKAYAYTLHTDSSKTFCDCCLQPASPQILRCSRCKTVYYIDQQHQRTGWPWHKQECVALQAVPEHHRLPSDVFLALRTILKAHRLGQLTPEPPSSSSSAVEITDRSTYAGIMSLVSHWEDCSDEDKIKLAQSGAMTWQLLEKAQPEASSIITPRDITLLLARFSCNLHTICDDELQPFGVGIYPLISMINHSCTPNAVQSFTGSTMTIRAIKEIQPGDEVTIAYVELAAPRWERQRQLLKQYYFDIDDGTRHQKQQSVDSHYQDIESSNVVIRIHDNKLPPWPSDGSRDEALTQLIGGGGVWGEIIDTENLQALIHYWGILNDDDSSQAELIKFAERYAQALFLLQRSSSFLKHTHSSSIKQPALDEIQDSIESLKLGPRHVVLLRLREAALNAAISQAEFDTALQLAKDLLPIYEYLYPPMWWPLGVHYAKLAKLIDYQGNDVAGAVRYAHQAIAILETVIGPGRQIIRDMEIIRTMASTELAEAI